MNLSVDISIAFLAGLASFLSPCVFSLVPVYIGYLSGRSAVSDQQEGTNRWETFSHGLAFVVGFSVVFILLGLAASGLSVLLNSYRGWISKLGGVLVVLFGLHMTGLLRIPFLEYDLRPQTQLDRQRSYLSSFLLGVFFSAGWSPCVGPTLGAILTLAYQWNSMMEAVYLLGAYSAGLAIPFLAAALTIGWVGYLLRRYRKLTHYVEMGMGVVMILMGVLLFLGSFEQLGRFGLFVDFGL